MCVHVYIMYICTYICTCVIYGDGISQKKKMSKSTAKIFEGIPSNLIYPKDLCK